jgi:putative transcriptional regulator
MGTSLKETLHETAKGLYEMGAIDKERFDRFEALRLSSDNLPCEPLEVEELSPIEIRELRNRNSLSEADFALFLHTTISTIKSWESGTKKPKGPELTLLNIIRQKGLKGLSARA